MYRLCVIIDIETLLYYNLVSKMCKDESSSDSSFNTSSSTNSDDNSDTDLLLIKRIRVKHVKIDNFVSKIVPLFSEIDFKTHFRLSRISVEVCAKCYMILIKSIHQIVLKYWPSNIHRWRHIAIRSMKMRWICAEFKNSPILEKSSCKQIKHYLSIEFVKGNM